MNKREQILLSITLLIPFISGVSCSQSEGASSLDRYSICVSQGDSLIGVFQVDALKDTIVLTINKEKNNNGTNPFFIRRDTSKYELRTTRTLSITSGENILDKTVDSVYYNKKYYQSSYSFCIRGYEIISSRWHDVYGGVGGSSFYCNGYYISEPTRNGGYIINKKMPDDTLKTEMDSGDLIYLYDYDEAGRVVSISSKEDSCLIYSVKRNELGQWITITYRDFIIRKKGNETD